MWGVLNISLQIIQQFREFFMRFWLIDFCFITNKMANNNIKSNIVWVLYFQRRNYHQNWEINHPELTCGLLQTCHAKQLCCYYTSWDILCPNILEQNKQVKKICYAMDIYSVKQPQPQNIIIKVKMKEHENGKKEYWKKS